jgi:NADH-quinone oxidoreductase subunit L
MAIAVAALLLGGAMGKSAQLPLQTWLPDAMAGPTPVSALIHAATMVTAGVYLIARMHGLFLLAPPVMTATAVIGAATLFIAGSAALVQSDIKRILAYSTISQLGYMFLALGVGAWSAAMFHFMTHAFFKALLFLGAGVVIHCLHHEHDIFKMGGLKKRLPATFWVFLAGGASLAGLPLVTAGFYSKDLILWQAWSSNRGGSLLWIIGIATAFMTALYTFRLIFIVFFGAEKTHVEKRPGIPMMLPLFILAVLSIIAGFIETPPALGNIKWFSAFINSSLPAEMEAHASHGAEIILGLVAAILAIAGISLAYVLYVRKQIHETAGQQAAANPLRQFLKSGWGFDKAYDVMLVQPFIRIAAFGKNDFVDKIYSGIAALFRGLNVLLSATETGRLRFYAAGIALGTIIFVAIALFI